MYVGAAWVARLSCCPTVGRAAAHISTGVPVEMWAVRERVVKKEKRKRRTCTSTHIPQGAGPRNKAAKMRGHPNNAGQFLFWAGRARGGHKHLNGVTSVGQESVQPQVLVLAQLIQEVA